MPTPTPAPKENSWTPGTLPPPSVTPEPGSAEFEARRAALVADFSRLPNQDKVSIVCMCGEHNMTPRQLVEEIRAGTDEGNKFVSLSFGVDQTLARIQAERSQENPLTKLRHGVHDAIERLRNLNW